VPVIALMGDRMASRMTSSILDAVGHPEWVASSEAEYVDKAVALANNVREREALRFAQRERIAASPLCDAKDLAKEMENAYLEMFRLWQEKQNRTVPS
ncbi:MAG: glycosyltransferase, partial [Gallionellaceae bacterium]|nr:glycosyltransferase [Gallionellaceae bacterium]